MSLRLSTLAMILAFMAPLHVFSEEAKETPAQTVMTFKDGTAFTVTYPTSMTLAGKFDKDSPAAYAKIRSKNGKMSLQITAFLDPKKGPVLDQAGVEKMVENTGALQYQPGSVEGKTEVRKLAIADGVGAIASYTDKDLVGKEDRPGKYKVVTTGTIKLGESVLAITLLADSFTSQEYLDGLAILENLAVVK